MICEAGHCQGPGWGQGFVEGTGPQVSWVSGCQGWDPGQESHGSVPPMPRQEDSSEGGEDLPGRQV